jgi:hypothetical protein
MEEWKDVVGYKGIYEVSNLGNVRTCEGKVTYTNRHGVRHWNQRVLKPREDKRSKALSVSLWKNGSCRTYLIHRLVAMSFIPNPNNLETVNHKDGNRHNNHVDNLEWMSRADNIRHGFTTGLYTCQTPIVIVDKETEHAYYFHSLSKAGEFMGHGDKYLSGAIKKNQYENKKFKWALFI